MEMIPAQLAEKIEETHDAVIELKTLLKGTNGSPGICDQVESNRKRIRHIELLLAFAAGGGGLTVVLTKLVGG